MDELKETTYSSSHPKAEFSHSAPLLDIQGFPRIRSQTYFLRDNDEHEKEILNRTKMYKCYEFEGITAKDISPNHCELTISVPTYDNINTEDSINGSPRDTGEYFKSDKPFDTFSPDTINTPDIPNQIGLNKSVWGVNRYEFESIFSEIKVSALRRVISVDFTSDVQQPKTSFFDQQRRNSFCNNDKFLGKVYCAAQISIDKIIGEGFFGRVYKIVDKSTNQVLVMKELKCADYRAQKQFITEIELVRHLNHPNLVKFIGIVFINKKINVILEFIEFGTLRKLIKDFNLEIHQKSKLKIALDIATGMSYLHSKKIAHRDLTSKNCLIKDLNNFDVVVSDFGLSRVIHRIPSFFPTKQPIKLETVGTAFWMAPEMLMGFDYDHNVDIFSYGIVMCELLARTSAHPDNIPRLNNFGLDEHGFLEKIRSISNPPLLISIALKCCRMNPSTRPSFVGIRHSLQRRYDIDFSVGLFDRFETSYLHPLKHTKSCSLSPSQNQNKL